MEKLRNRLDVSLLSNKKRLFKNGHQNQAAWHKKYLVAIRKSKVTLKLKKHSYVGRVY